MWPGTATSGGWRSPQAFAGTPNNTREPAQTDKKKPQLITVGASVLVVKHGTEPASAFFARVRPQAYSPDFRSFGRFSGHSPNGDDRQSRLVRCCDG